MPLDAALDALAHPVQALRRAQLRADYHATFNTVAGERVLADLHRFCFGSEETFHPDPHIAAHNQGLRRVYLRIRGMMKLTDEDMARIVADNAMRPQQEDTDGED